jgi:UDP-N-acetylmuramoylalanine--D-glutamate ligase
MTPVTTFPATVVAGDDNPAGLAAAAQAGVQTADLAATDWSRFAALVLAPGIPLTHPEPHWTVEKAKAAGVEIIEVRGEAFRALVAALPGIELRRRGPT